MKYRFTYRGIWQTNNITRPILSTTEWNSEDEFNRDATVRELYRNYTLLGILRFKYRLSDNVMVKMAVKTTGDYE